MQKDGGAVTGEDKAERPSIVGCRVLIIDDNKVNQSLIGSLLVSEGIVNCEFAGDGVEGLAKLDAFDPDLVILDIMMPNMDGYGFLERMRAEPKYSDLPTLVATALGDPQDRNKAFAAGGTDLVVRPINGIELLARVRIHLENRILLRDLKAYRLRLESELTMARKMQKALLPDDAATMEIAKKYNLGIESIFKTSSEIGGDIWGAQCLDDQRLGIFTVDFSGHGVNSALNTFRLHTLMESLGMSADDPSSYLSALGTELHSLLPRGQFATMFYGIVDIRTNSLTYSAAASTSPVIGNLESGDFTFKEAHGLPLGISKGAKYQNRVVDFPPGSFLFLYSDALIETPLGDDEMLLGEEGLAELVRKGLSSHDQASPLSTVIGLFDTRAPDTLPDDLTAVWLART